MDVSDSGGIALSSVIDYAPAVLDDACTHVTTALERPAVEGAEIGGVLFGTHSARGVIVLALRPVESMPGDAPAFEQAIALHQTDASLAGTEPVGCFVSHPRDSLVLRPSERDIFNRHFPQPRQIVLVVRPGMIGSFRAATIGRAAGKPQGVVLNSFIIRRIRNGLAHPPPDVPTWLPAPAPMNVIAPTTSSEKPPAPALAPSRTLRPRSLRQEAPRPTPASPVPARKAWAWQPAVAIVCVLAVTLAAFVYLRSRAMDSIGLRAYLRDGVLLIDWNARSRTIARATTARLKVIDGDAVMVRDLLQEDLMRGLWAARCIRSDCTVKLALYDGAGYIKEEMALYRGRTALPAGSDPGVVQVLGREKSPLKNGERLKALRKVVQRHYLSP